jgi:hypothetical protein
LEQMSVSTSVDNHTLSNVLSIARETVSQGKAIL